MRKTKIIILVLVVAALLSVVGCSNLSKKSLDLGTMEGTKYSNEYFNMTLELPESWTVLSEDEKKELMNEGREVVAGENKDFEEALRNNEFRSVYLISTYKHPLNTEVDFNTNFMSLAEKLSFFQNVKDGKGYLEESKKLLEKTQVPYIFEKDISTEKVGNKDFYVMETYIEAGEMRVTQKYYSIIEKGYALSFILSYSNDEDKKAVQDILNTVKFN